jgi:hypothetical protein
MCKYCTYTQRRNKRNVSALSAGAYTTTLLVMVDKVKGGRGVHPLPSPEFTITCMYDGMYARVGRYTPPISALRLYLLSVCIFPMLFLARIQHSKLKPTGVWPSTTSVWPGWKHIYV